MEKSDNSSPEGNNDVENRENVPPDDSDEELPEIERIRQKNIAEFQAFLDKCKEEDPFFNEAITAINEYNKSQRKTQKVRKPRKPKDSTFRYTGAIPLAPRKSARLENKAPEYIDRSIIDDNSIDNIERVVYKPRRRITHFSTRATPHRVIPVEEITDEMLDNIAMDVSLKVYDSANGSSCHQCRQKTRDTKTVCRNPNCVGVRGQFCGVCLNNRYGENAREVLKKSDWHCPVCRGICNCSFCRSKAGMRPTGVMSPLAQKQGHASVRHYLDSLKGQGDYPHEDAYYELLNDPGSLIGFSGSEYCFVGGKEDAGEADKLQLRLIEEKIARLTGEVSALKTSKLFL